MSSNLENPQSRKHKKRRVTEISRIWTKEKKQEKKKGKKKQRPYDKGRDSLVAHIRGEGFKGTPNL